MNWLDTRRFRPQLSRPVRSHQRKTPRLRVEVLESRDLLSFDPFTVAVIPDTQFYSQAYPQTFHAQTQWIVDNLASQSIAFVTHEGDIVQNGDQGANRNLVEWQRADAAMTRLDGNLGINPDGLVPYSAVIGNHDYTVPGQHNSGAARYLEFFGPARYQGRSWYGGSSPNGLNHYQIFSAGGWRFLHLGIEWEATDADLAWAETVLASNPTLPTLLTTHSYLNPTTRRRQTTLEGQDGNPGEQVFQKFVYPNPQVFMVLNGHYSNEFHQVSTNVLGQPVFEMVADYQSRPNGGNGWLRLLQFLPLENRIQVRTYSPTLNQYETDANSQFELPLDFTARFGAPDLYGYTVSNFQYGAVSGGATYLGTVDTQLKQNAPGTAYGTNTLDLLVDARSAGMTDESQALLRFDDLIGYGPGQIHPGATILNAELIVNSANAGHGGRLHRMLRSWQGSDTWNSQGGGVQADGIEATVGYASQAGFTGLAPLVPQLGGLRLNVTRDVGAWSAGEANHGWAMLSWVNGTDGWAFSPSETTALEGRPRLRVEWLPWWYPVSTFQQGADHGGGAYSGAVDTYLHAAAPGTQYGTSSITWIDGPQDNDTRHGLLRFDKLFGNNPGQIPPDAYIFSARLYLTTPYGYAQAPGGGASPHLVFLPWTDTATWGGSFGGDGIQPNDYDAYSVPEPNTGVVGFGTHSFDVWLSLLYWQWGIPNEGLALLPNTSDGWAFGSSEFGIPAERPRLVVVWWPSTGPGDSPSQPAAQRDDTPVIDLADVFRREDGIGWTPPLTTETTSPSDRAALMRQKPEVGILGGESPSWLEASELASTGWPSETRKQAEVSWLDAMSVGEPWMLLLDHREAT